MSIDHEFQEHFDVAPTLRIRCPGRVNLIGEHIDYMGYGVFPMAIEQETVVLVAPTSDRAIKFHNVDPAAFSDFEITLPSQWKGASPPKWYDYFLSGWKGALEHLAIPVEDVKGMLIQVSGQYLGKNEPETLKEFFPSFVPRISPFFYIFLYKNYSHVLINF